LLFGFDMAESSMKERLKKLAITLEVGARSTNEQSYIFALKRLYSHFPELREEVKKEIEKHVIVGVT